MQGLFYYSPYAENVQEIRSKNDFKMNRSFFSVIFGGFGNIAPPSSSQVEIVGTVKTLQLKKLVNYYKMPNIFSSSLFMGWPQLKLNTHFMKQGKTVDALVELLAAN